MPDTNDANTNIPEVPVADTTAAEVETDNSNNVMSEVASKVAESHNILVALSSDPSVDEMAAAIGLSLYLDRIGKRVTAIYSGNTPNALEFLKPEETFEHDTDILQDFVIALNKEKADHLRYKLDGDYVKIFITPYRSRITSEDLEFSYGDFNVDLVLALDVANGVDLDDALREHGRIMHDAVVVNITTGKPGKLGEIEWSDKSASSVSEMVAELLYGMNNKEKLGKEEATAFLTGIVAATNRFANAGTTPKTMKLSSRLMESGANQQLISKNITGDIENEFFSFKSSSSKDQKSAADPTTLDIAHGDSAEEDAEETTDDSKEIDATVTEKDNSLLEDLKAAEASLASAGAEATEEEKEKPVRLDSESMPEAQATAQDAALPEPVVPDNSFAAEVKPEKVIAPPTDFTPETLSEGTNKYGQMLEDALAEDGDTIGATGPIASPSVEPMPDFNNPAASFAPAAPTAPEINGVPEINYMPLPGDEVLPPPPAPPIDFGTPAPMAASQPIPEPVTASAPMASTPVEPTSSPVEQPTPLGPQPAMQDQIYQPQAATPDAFKIPGM